MSCFICSRGVQRRPSDRYDQIYNPQRKEVWTVRQRIRRYVVSSEKNDSVLAILCIFCTLIETRMHSSRMRTVHCSGCLSCHSCPLHHACPSCHTHPLSCMPPPTHTPCHARPPPVDRQTPFRNYYCGR